MRRTLLLIITICLSFYSADAQSCSSIEEWDILITNEFPNVDTNTINSGGKTSNRILYNLYSDKYFIPFSNKSFEKLSFNSGVKTWKKLRNCRSKNKYQNLKNIGWITHFGLSPLSNEIAFNQVKKKSGEINNLRGEYNRIVNKFESGDVSYDELIRYKKLANTSFNSLMPSEVDHFLKLILENESTIANKSLLQSANQYTLREGNLNTLNDLENFKQLNQKMYAQANDDTRKVVTTILSDKKSAVLEVLMQNESNRLRQIGSGEIGLVNINSFFKNFENLYSKYQNYNSVNILYQDVVIGKTKIVSDLKENVSNKIANAKTPNQINDIESKYLSNTNKEDQMIVLINNYLLARKNTILNQIEVDRLKAELEARNKRLKETETKLAQLEKAVEIIDNYHRAIGGMVNLKNIKSTNYTMTPEINQDLSVFEVSGLNDFEMNTTEMRVEKSIFSSSLFKAYDKDGNLLKLQKIFYDGKGARSIRRSFPGGVSYPSLEHVEKEFENKDGLFSFENYKTSKFIKEVSYLGFETIEKIKYHKITYQTYNAYFGWRTGYAYFDVETHLLKIIKAWSPSNKEGWNYFENYKEVDGIKVPTRVYIGVNKYWVKVVTEFNMKNLPSNTFTYDF
ncbi:hypothetical protein [Cyclobacterium qasimii]|uniref:Uncharacterized protein n=2 Tax=Cyclobacterium qasimii TaxID=1350429 RepID=S7VNX4_9BACT|nr:hypothetical protein [Cyclobacterium qasimii]EPR71072.1 hypothetical protein ADICYQ_0663 [Cyclobacterium qasimii M12-11B]GEO24205.1 hypothetical protein CQA01_47390 [Cyclobacterium qasimii]